MDTEYIVQHGDSLTSISAKVYGSPVHWPAIAERNALYPPYTIFSAQILKLPTNSRAQPGVAAASQTPSARMALARGFQYLFVVEQLPDVGTGTKLIRKVALVPKQFTGTTRQQWIEWKEGHPERFGIEPRNPQGSTSWLEHVQGQGLKDSPRVSASNKPYGAPTMKGRPVLIDVATIQRAGGKVLPPEVAVRGLRAMVSQNPNANPNLERLIRAIGEWEGESGIEGKKTPRDAVSTPGLNHGAYIRKAEQLYEAFKHDPPKLTQELAALERSYGQAAKVAKGLRVVGGVGMIFTAVDVTKASVKSIEQRSFKPIGAEVIRHGTSWGMAWAGAKAGFLMGGAFGIETGPGAILTGAVGALVGGYIGYRSGDAVGDLIDAN